MSGNTRGEVRKTAGLPGTGLSYTEQTTLGGDDQAAQPDPEQLQGGAKRRSPRKIVGWTSVAVLVLIAVLGAPTLAGYIILPAIALTIAAPWLARRLSKTR